MAETSNPVALPSKKQKRTLPFHKEEDSLEDKAARSVVEQYLEKYPERIGHLIARMELHKRSQVMQHIPSKEMLRPVAMYSYQLIPDDTIAILHFHDSAADMDYALLKVSELPDFMSSVLGYWLEDWTGSYNTADKRTNHVEHDGSATLALDAEIDELSDAIERHVVVLQETFEQEGEENEESEEEFDFDSKIEEVTDDIQQWLGGSEWVKVEPKESFRLFMRAPKLTIRFDSE